jgi:anti-sigma-K factor RskA
VKYQSEQVRDALAAEYALGTLQGPARRRFERSLKEDPRLRQLVAQWQTRLAPLDALIEPVRPPARVWQAVRDRIEAGSRRRALGGVRGFWTNLGFWRGAALASAAVAAALAVALVVIAPATQPRDTMVVVMSDDNSAPAMTVSWPTQQTGNPKLRIRVLGHPDMPAGTAWELWVITGGDRKPVSLGLINTDPTQELVIPQKLAPVINSAWGLAMSVEPRGGSPTGLPTGPVIYKGQRIGL